MAGSTLTQPVVSPPKPAISTTVVSPSPTQRTCTRAPEEPTSWSIVAVGRGAVVAVTVVGAAGVLDVELTMGVVGVVTELVEAPVVVVAVVLPHAVELRSAAVRTTTLRRRMLGRWVLFVLLVIGSMVLFMGATIDLRGG